MTFQQIERQRESFRRKWEREFRDTLEDQFTIYMDVWRSTGNKRAARQAVEEPEPMRESYRKFYRAVGTYFAIRQYADLQKLKDAPPRDYWTDKIDDYVRRTGKTKAQAINAYSAELLGAMTSEVSLEVLDDVEYEKLGNDWRDIVITRSERIFQTEVVCASELGKVEAAKYVRDEEGLPTMKRWQANLDAGVREAHYYADGKEAELDEYFTVGGEQLRFPGDTSGGATAKNLINCRCANEYFKGDGVPKPPDAEPEPTSTEDLQREQEKQPEPKPVPVERIDVRKRSRVGGKTWKEVEMELDEIAFDSDEINQQLKEIEERQEAVNDKYAKLTRGSQSEKYYAEWREQNELLERERAPLVSKMASVEERILDVIRLPKDLRSEIKIPGNAFGGDQDMISRMEKAVDFLTSIVAKDALPRDLRIATKKLNEERRAFFKPSPSVIEGTINIGGESVRTYVHEIAHAYEVLDTNIFNDSYTFYRHRTINDELRWLGPGFRENEKTRADRFFDPYVGKDYYEQNGSRSTEVISMGLEQMYYNPEQFYRQDRDHFLFILKLFQSNPSG